VDVSKRQTGSREADGIELDCCQPVDELGLEGSQDVGKVGVATLERENARQEVFVASLRVGGRPK
jgi:hypothetical protein